MFLWIVPVAIAVGVLGLIDSLVCIFLIAFNVKDKIIKFFMDTLFALLLLFYILLVIIIIYKIWIEYLPV